MTIAERLATKAKQELEIIEPLNDKDRKDWKRLREEVSAHQDAVCSFTASLADIRDRRLYREDYGTFDAFVDAELSLSKRHINRLIHHEEVKRILGPRGPKITEMESRALTNVPPKKIRAVVKKATAKAKSEGRKRTASDVKESANPTTEKPESKQEPKQPDSPQALQAPIQAVATQLTGMLKELKRLADHVGGEWLDLTDLETQINALKYSIRQSIYWMDCMDCEGKGCKTCHKHGWLSLDRKKYLTQDQKDKVGA